MADAPDLGSGPERVGGSSPLVRTILFQEICKCAVFPDRFLTNLAMNAPRRFGSHGHVASPHLLLKDGKSPRSIKQTRRLPQKPLNLGLRDQRAPLLYGNNNCQSVPKHLF